MQTQVAIIGAGPTGLFLGHLLHQEGIDTVILENRNEKYLRSHRKGAMIEPAIAQCLVESGVGNLLKNGIEVEGIRFHYDGQKQRIEFEDKKPIIYNQHDLIGEFINLRKQAQQAIIFEGKAQRYEGLDTGNPKVHYTLNANLHELDCEYVIGCDGFRGISRRVIPVNTRKEIKEELPYAWLDWLVDAPPNIKEPVYGCHKDGLALQMPTSDGKTRLHFQIDRGIEKDDLAGEAEIWQHMEMRLNMKLNRGDVIQQKLDYMRQFHTQNWQHGRLFIAGDAAHIVERTSSKGLSLALGDAIDLAKALSTFYKRGDTIYLDEYTNHGLARISNKRQFEAWFTKLMHTSSSDSAEENQEELQEIIDLFDDKVEVNNLVQNFIG